MTIGSLRRRSAQLSLLVGGVLVVLLLALASEVLAILLGRYPHPSLLIFRLPMVAYLWAIVVLRRALLAIASGLAFDEVLPRMLRGVGLALFAGAASAVVIVPLALRIARGAGPIAHYDVAAITLGVVGLVLLVLAALMHRAVSMSAELDTII